MRACYMEYITTAHIVLSILITICLQAAQDKYILLACILYLLTLSYNLYWGAVFLFYMLN